MGSAKKARRQGARSSTVMLAVTCAACALAPPAAASVVDAMPATGVGGRSPYVPGEAIVRFEPATSAADRRDARRAAGVEFDDALPLPRVQLVEVAGLVESAVRRLERQPGVAYAQPNYRYEALAVPPPDDTFFDKLWGLSDPALPDPGVSALEAWEDGKGGGQVIAVVDTGVDLTHPDIEGNLWTNPGPDPGPHGYDFVDDDGDPDDYNFHGTHVAGTAAAVADNNLGIAGVAPEAQIMAVRVLDGDGEGTTADIAAGIAYAASNGADAINLSLGGPIGEDEAMSDAVDVAAAKDAVVVAAAGNEGTDNDVVPTMPCALPQANLICVAALNQSGGIASFSNFGAKSVDLAAPGTGILSAKVDYGAPVFSDGFETGLGLWTTQELNGGIPWGESSSAASGAKSATDSPGGDYGQAPEFEEAVSNLFTTAAVDLTAERGCRVHFQTMYKTEPLFDFFVAGAIAGTSADFREFDGASPGYPDTFEAEEASVSDLDDRDDVHPAFALLSDEALQLDGAYVDDVRLICRDETYIDAIAPVGQYDQPDAGSYIRFQGTSMAAPHVTGVAALVRSAAPGTSATQVVGAILDGASALPNDDPARLTVTHGIADACQAIAMATGGSIADCPGSSENVVPPPPPPIALGAASAPPSVADRISPRTFFGHHPPRVVRTRNRKATVAFRFRSNEHGVAFICKVDAGLLRFCLERLRRGFGIGKHVVSVRARDAAGNVDPTPATFRFEVRRVG